MRITLSLLLVMLLGISATTRAQDSTSLLGRITNFPGKFFSRINNKTTDLNKELTKQTEKYLNSLSRKEAKLKRKLFRYDSTAAKSLFASNPQTQYVAMIQKMKTDTSRSAQYMGSEYQPNLDTLQTTLNFLNKNPQVFNIPNISAIPGSKVLSASPASTSLQQLQQLQSKLQNADYIRQLVQQRKAQIQQYLAKCAHLPPGVSNIYQGYNKQVYYYSQQLRSYKDQLNDPDKMMGTALGLLYKLPAFNSFMRQNSFLASMFNIPDNYGSSKGVEGLQTRDQVNALINGKIGQGGPNAASAVQNSLQRAKQDISKIREKIGALGGGNGDMDMPNFKPNPQKTKTFLKRLEYGTNIQTVHGAYYFPITTDLGLSVGYKITDKNTIGVGASYKIGWGTDIRHIGLSSQGAGLRSFLDINVKKSWYASGGYELNYQPIAGIDIGSPNSWTKSGLIGVSKIVSMNTKMFKKTKLSFLWDFLSYQQIPKTQPFVFRVGYSF